MNEAEKIQKQMEKERKELEWNVVHEIKDSEVEGFSEEVLEQSRKVDELIIEYLEAVNKTLENVEKNEEYEIESEKIEKNQ
ncbi:MAG: hypothetical protein IKJ01_08530 [Lachnospiraceae bacterium]|nr:hypothetical protein [Lachnospiraceae bacterium]